MIELTRAFDSRQYHFFINDKGIFIREEIFDSEQVEYSLTTSLISELKRPLKKYSIFLKDKTYSLFNLEEIISNGFDCRRLHTAIKLLVKELIYLRDRKENICDDLISPKTKKRLKRSYLLPISKKDIEISKYGNSLYIKLSSIAKYFKTNVKGLREILKKESWLKIPDKLAFYIELDKLLQILLEQFDFSYSSYEFERKFKLFNWLRNSVYPSLVSLKECKTYSESEYELLEIDAKMKYAIKTTADVFKTLGIDAQEEILNIISKEKNIPFEILKKLY